MAIQHIAPKKSLGQNFLTNRNVAHKIIAALDAQQGDAVLEIGPGEGALTNELASLPLASLLAVEFDIRSVQLLAAQFSAATHPHVSLHHGDIRSFALQPYAVQQWEQHERKLKVIGNIPYNITSDILFWLYEATPLLDRAIIMMQKEVAQRLVAAPRTKDYGILTVATSFCATARMLFDVAPGSFFPRPSVTSSVVELRFPSRTGVPPAVYTSVKPLINAAFSQRRKVLSNALKTYITSRTATPYTTILERAESQGIPYFRKRAEELLPKDFLVLWEFIVAQSDNRAQ